MPGSLIQSPNGNTVSPEDPELLAKSELFIRSLAEQMLGSAKSLTVVCSGYEGKFKVQELFRSTLASAKFRGLQESEKIECAGDIYITLGGGPAVKKEADTAADRPGVRVVPITWTGGFTAKIESPLAVATTDPELAAREVASIVAEESATRIPILCILGSGIPGSLVKNPAGEVVSPEDPDLLSKSETFIKSLGKFLVENSLGNFQVVCSGYGGKFQVQELFRTECLSRTFQTLNEQERIEDVGDIYITLGGGPAVKKEADAASTRPGVKLLPITWTGGFTAKIESSLAVTAADPEAAATEVATAIFRD